MRIIPDLLPRYDHLVVLAEDENVINSDGTRVDPFLELASEAFEKRVNQVTFEERNFAIRLIDSARYRQDLENKIKSGQWRSGQTFTQPGAPWDKPRRW